MDTLYFQEFSKNRELEKKFRKAENRCPQTTESSRTLYYMAEYTCRSTSTRKQSHVPMIDVSFLGTDYTDFTDIFDGECNTLFLLTPSTAISEGDSSKCNTM